jgi:hypothetical protein
MIAVIAAQRDPSSLGATVSALLKVIVAACAVTSASLESQRE